jgi:hypothetical protein
MTINLDAAIDRIVEIEIAALATLSITADAVPYFFHTQESFPYWTNRVGVVTIAGRSEDIDEPVYTVISRLIISHLTADYVGVNEDKLKTWIPVIIRYFHARPWLETATQTSGLANLLFARITDCTGFRVFQAVGIETAQIGCEFTHRLEFEETIQLISG